MSFSDDRQEYFMRLAMEQADISIRSGDGPFGAVLVGAKGGVVAAAHNTVYSANDPTAHAEINLIRQVSQEFGRDRFAAGGAIVVNAASCAMCASALIRVGVRDFYYGAPFEPHTNPAITYEGLAEFCRDPIKVVGGILVDECVAQIQRGRHRQVDAGIRYSK